jgi:hypothetical protein
MGVIVTPDASAGTRNCVSPSSVRAVTRSCSDCAAASTGDFAPEST